MGRSKAPKTKRWRRRLLTGSAVVAVGVPALWVAIHEVPWLGPALADGVRAVVGPGPVAWAEDVAYDIADRINRLRHGGDKPKTYWDDQPQAAAQPQATTQPAAEPGETAPASTPREDGQAPANFAPPFANVAAEGDGTWIPMPDGVDPAAAPAMFKTLVHPDPKRTFAAVAIVAIDLERIELRMVAGTLEPHSPSIPKERRPGAIESEHMRDLVAVFNGGFKAMHGHWGMAINGDVLVAPRDIGCTLGFFRDGSLRIQTWSTLKASEPELTAYRQTPPCLVEDGSTHKALAQEYNKNWGASVSGETIIRRSAIGLDERGRTLFYALGDAVTAQSLARAMSAAGARSAAQLDVNYSYPRFLTYTHPSPSEPPKCTAGLIPDLKFTSWEYVREPSPRDFFYLTRRRRSS